MIRFSFLPKQKILVVYLQKSEEYVLPNELIDECHKISTELSDRRPQQVIFVGQIDFWHKNIRIDTFSSLYNCMSWAKNWRSFLKNIKELSIPTYAYIQGRCDSVGLELALACRYRIAHHQANFSCHDVRHGHLPVGGSLFRLISLCGVNETLNFLLLGSPVSAEQAKNNHLVHSVTYWDFDEREMILPRLEQRRFQLFFEDLPWARGYLFRHWRQEIINRFRGHFRSPLKLMEVIERGWFKGGKTRGQLEMEAFSELVFSSQAHVLEYVHSRLRTFYKTKPLHGLRGLIRGGGHLSGELASLFAPFCSMTLCDTSVALLEESAKVFRLDGATVELSAQVLDDENFDFVLVPKDDGGFLYQCHLSRNELSFFVRFFYPFKDRKIVEIYSEDSRISSFIPLFLTMGKIPLQIRGQSSVTKSPVIRLALSLFQEAYLLKANGYSTDDIQKAWEDMGMRPEIFELWRESSHDQFHSYSQILNEAFPERFWMNPPKCTLTQATDLQHFFIFRLLKEAFLLLEEKIICEPFFVDLLMIYGLGFPRYQGGLLHHIDSVGTALWLKNMQDMAILNGERFSPPDIFKQMVEAKRQIYDRSVL